MVDKPKGKETIFHGPLDGGRRFEAKIVELTRFDVREVAIFSADNRLLATHSIRRESFATRHDAETAAAEQAQKLSSGARGSA